MIDEVKVTDIGKRIRALKDANNLQAVAVMAFCEIGLLHSLIELMALHVPREKMPAAERIMLDIVLEQS
jgi:hypothetical protein